MISSSDILYGKILIVDDLEVNVILIERMLRGAGYVSITSTMDPREVCGLHLENRYDLILLDLQMPGMDGFEVMEALKEIETGGYLPVLVITAQPDQKLRALKAGAKDFIGKPFEMAEVLARVHNMLEVRLLHLETKKLYDQIVAEQKVSERLLLNVLPCSITERLKGRPEGIADNRGLEKIKTIGDAYMAASGLPVPVADHAIPVAHMALDMIEEMERFNEHNGYELKVRIGINTGAVVAGVIGRRKFLYDLWGDVVNTASRMESQGVAGRIQVTDATRQRLNDSFMLEERGTIDVKGKGEMHPWFLNSRNC
jgi:adenylate cyclase